MNMTLNRNHVHVGKNGLSIQFLKDKPTHVPPKLVEDVLGIGGVIADDDQAAVSATMNEINENKRARDDRAPSIEDAIRQLIKRNARGDFTAGGRPNLNQLAKITGFLIDSEELEPRWNKVKAELE